MTKRASEASVQAEVAKWHIKAIASDVAACAVMAEHHPNLDRHRIDAAILDRRRMMVEALERKRAARS